MKNKYVKSLEDFIINELLISKDFNTVKNIESLFFVIYKKDVYFIGFDDNNFVEKTKELQNRLSTELNKDYVVDDFDSAIGFFEKYLNIFPNIVNGTFRYNKFNKSIPNDVIICEIYHKNYLDIRYSPLLQKILKLLPEIDYFEINKEILHSDDLKNTDIKFVYHGTSSIYINNILKYGIKPNPDNTVYNNIKHKNKIFLTTDLNIAKYYAETITSIKDGDEIVLEVDFKALNKNKFVVDYDFYKQFISNNSYKDYDDLGSFNDKIIKNTYDFNSITNYLQFKRFGYNGIVYPNLIKNIYVKDFDGFKKYSVEEYKKIID